MQPESRFEYLKHMSEEDRDTKAILQDLMDSYGKDVWNFAYSMTRKWDLADDITQDVFIKVYRKLHTFRFESSVKTWLLSITRNTVLDHRKSAFIRKVTLVDVISEKRNERSAETEVIEALAVNDVWKLVLRLPYKYREVIILYAHHQMSMHEMAELLGVSEGTVKSRLFHARRKVAAMKGVEESGLHE